MIQSLNFDIYYPLLSWYFRSKKTRVPPDFEVVSVDLEGGNDSSLRLMPWLSCRFDPLRSAFVKNKLKTVCGTLAAFGRDGQLVHWTLENSWSRMGPKIFYPMMAYVMRSRDMFSVYVGKSQKGKYTIITYEARKILVPRVSTFRRLRNA